VLLCKQQLQQLLWGNGGRTLLSRLRSELALSTNLLVLRGRIDTIGDGRQVPPSERRQGLRCERCHLHWQAESGLRLQAEWCRGQ